MTEQNIIDLVTELNAADEHPRLEAKRGVGDSLYETICAFANEPGLGGGRIILGVSPSEQDFFGAYEISGVADPDQTAADIASACATTFNLPLRPRIERATLAGKAVLCIEVDEFDPGRKPLYFKRHHLPRGAWRRIGTTDQRCSEDDLSVFYADRDREPYDARAIAGAEMRDIDPEAVEDYRRLRAKVNPTAEELKFDQLELLEALRAIRRENGEWRPTLAGLLLFGTRLALRRELPAMRVDYIRVAGKEWVPDPDKRYEFTIDMRGPLLQLVDRVQSAVMDDLPRGFELPEGSTRAVTPSLPAKAMREAIVNALMHRSYRLHQPIQIIRYSNRVEIVNAGYSLKGDDQLGSSGSLLRNPTLAEVFRDTNTAESKGTGIRVIREQMRAHGFSPPTFESDRVNDRFTARFLLHHFLSPEDLSWLATFPGPDLTEAQKYALIFARESGAIDNLTLRQLTGGEVLSTSAELRKLREAGFLEKRGGGAATYYVPGSGFRSALSGDEHGTLATEHGTLATEHGTLATEHGTLEALPEELRTLVASLGKRPGVAIRPVIWRLCDFRPWKGAELAAILEREPQALRRDHLAPMVAAGHLRLIHPEMERHPGQAYAAGEPLPTEP
jgi:ATP-dependent DNA helicase RecG